MIQDGLHLGIDYLGSLSAVGIQEVAVLIVGIIGAVNITVTERELEVGRDLAAPLGHALFFCLLDSSFDCLHSLGITFGNDSAHAVFRLGVVDGDRLPAMQVGKTAGDDDLSLVIFHYLVPP